MSDEVLKKVGRGGAGNFWSKKDLEEAERVQEVPNLCPRMFLIYPCDTFVILNSEAY
jgi:hypothetical protein